MHSDTLMRRAALRRILSLDLHIYVVIFMAIGEDTMNDFLPDAVRQGLDQARKASLRRKDRLCVHDGDHVYGIRRFWEGGFALDADVAEKLRGRVEIYDGARHLYQCLIVGSAVERDERVFDFKWLHPVTDAAPVDYERPGFVPAGLITG